MGPDGPERKSRREIELERQIQHVIASLRTQDVLSSLRDLAGVNYPLQQVIQDVVEEIRGLEALHQGVETDEGVSIPLTRNQEVAKDRFIAALSDAFSEAVITFFYAGFTSPDLIPAISPAVTNLWKQSGISEALITQSQDEFTRQSVTDKDAFEALIRAAIVKGVRSGMSDRELYADLLRSFRFDLYDIEDFRIDPFALYLDSEGNPSKKLKEVVEEIRFGKRQ